jgi:hypothetical protein
MNAAENPFRVSRIHALPFVWPENISPESLTRRWRTLGSNAALVAPHGHGKSTLLQEWSRHLRGMGFEIYNLTLRSDQRRIPPGYTLPRRERVIAVLDGAEQLGCLGWQRWLHATRHADGRITTQHRPGRFPTLQELRSDPSLLRQLLARLLDDNFSNLPASPEDLFARHHGNLRDIFRSLYDHWAQL